MIITSPKHIGIASITAEGGALAYLEVVHSAERLLGPDVHPEISLHSHSFSKFTKPNSLQDGSWERLLVESSQKLAASGAEFFICPANTNHIVYDKVLSQIAIPWLHIAEIVAERAASQGCKTSLLLGTKTLMQSDVYPHYFDRANISIELPQSEEQELLNTIIYKELVRGVVTDSSRETVRKIIDRYLSSGCDSVILGCTELPILVSELPQGATLLDSTRLVAKGAVAYSLGKRLSEIDFLD